MEEAYEASPREIKFHPQQEYGLADPNMGLFEQEQEEEEEDDDDEHEAHEEQKENKSGQKMLRLNEQQ